jgi:hypothetical protein
MAKILKDSSSKSAHFADNNIFAQPSETLNRCPSCDSTGIHLIKMQSSCNHHAVRRCGQCTRLLRWAAKLENQNFHHTQTQSVRRLLDLPDLSQWESEFLNVVSKQKKLSLKQAECFAKIEAKLGGVQ